jgi:hypothetical protein
MKYQDMMRIILPGVLFVVVSGCGGNQVNSPTPLPQSPTSSATPAVVTQTPNAQFLDIQHQWEESPHAQVEDEVSCDICHPLQNGVITEKVARWDRSNGRYEPVSDHNDLCLTCHEGYDHAEAAHKDFLCLDCHDQHSTGASCFDCHQQITDLSGKVPATPVGGHSNGPDDACSGSGCHSSATQVARMPFSVHGVQHARVTCAACHDADGLQVGPLSDGSRWVSWSRSPVDGSDAPFYSHNLQYAVDCERCHFVDNPWGLATDNIQTGE